MFYEVLTGILLAGALLILLGYSRYEKKQAEAGREKILAAVGALSAGNRTNQADRPEPETRADETGGQESEGQ